MIYRNNIEPSKNLPENIQVCLNTYKKSLNDFALNDYKMRLNEKERDTHGSYNRAFRNALDNRTQARETMSQSLKAALVFAKDVCNEYGNQNILNETTEQFNFIIENSVYCGSKEPECNTNENISIENVLKNEIEVQKRMIATNINYVELDNENDLVI